MGNCEAVETGNGANKGQLLQGGEATRVHRFGEKFVKYSAGWLADTVTSLLPSWLSGTSYFYSFQTNVVHELPPQPAHCATVLQMYVHPIFLIFANRDM